MTRCQKRKKTNLEKSWVRCQGVWYVKGYFLNKRAPHQKSIVTHVTAQVTKHPPGRGAPPQLHQQPASVCCCCWWWWWAKQSRDKAWWANSQAPMCLIIRQFMKPFSLLEKNYARVCKQQIHKYRLEDLSTFYSLINWYRLEDLSTFYSQIHCYRLG
jgi:hypothetical protein